MMSFAKSIIKTIGAAALLIAALQGVDAHADEASDARQATIAVYLNFRTPVTDGYLAGFEVASRNQNVPGALPKGARYIRQESGVSIEAAQPKDLTSADITNGLTWQQGFYFRAKMMRIKEPNGVWTEWRDLSSAGPLVVCTATVQAKVGTTVRCTDGGFLPPAFRAFTPDASELQG